MLRCDVELRYTDTAETPRRPYPEVPQCDPETEPSARNLDGLDSTLVQSSYAGGKARTNEEVAGAEAILPDAEP